MQVQACTRPSAYTILHVLHECHEVANVLQNVLRKPGTCFLRTSEGDLLPVTSKRDAAGIHRFVAGDGRVNEHAILTTMHTTWMREHNRLCRIMGENPTFADMSADEKFTRARQVRVQPGLQLASALNLAHC